MNKTAPVLVELRRVVGATDPETAHRQMGSTEGCKQNKGRREGAREGGPVRGIRLGNTIAPWS